MYVFAHESPIGLLYVAVTSRGLRHLHVLHAHTFLDESLGFDGDEEVRTVASPSEEELAREVERQLDEYFDGTRREFDLPLDIDRGSEFQRRVWEAIRRIPYGEVASYAEVAQAAGAPGAFRAAGTACGANPVAIVTPCHRVIASGNKLGGYGLGIQNKVWLLRHEGIGAEAARKDARVFKMESAILGR